MYHKSDVYHFMLYYDVVRCDGKSHQGATLETIIRNTITLTPYNISLYAVCLQSIYTLYAPSCMSAVMRRGRTLLGDKLHSCLLLVGVVKRGDFGDRCSE
jgi:hypothetical protein